VRWGQLVISPLWAQELSFEHLLEIARTYRDREPRSFLPNVSLGSALPSLLCLPNRTTSRLAYFYLFHTSSKREEGGNGGDMIVQGDIAAMAIDATEQPTLTAERLLWLSGYSVVMAAARGWSSRHRQCRYNTLDFK
jgi:hypothetical protein